MHAMVLLPRPQPQSQREGALPHPQPAQELLQLLKRDEGVGMQGKQRLLLVAQGLRHQVFKEQHQDRPGKDLSHPFIHLRLLARKRRHLLRA